VFLNLSNEKLVDIYLSSLKLDLDKDFISLLELEISRRGIEIEKP
jgi:hypothetical protein